MYELILDGMYMPIAPSEIEINCGGQNSVVSMIDGNEINILKQPKLKVITFEVLLPNVKYPFAVYKDGFRNAEHYISKIRTLHSSKKPFRFIVIRNTPNGGLVNGEDIAVSLESYSIKESASNGIDVVVAITLKEYINYGSKKVEVSNGNEITVTQSRDASSSPKPSQNITHTVVSGDTLWHIAKIYYGDGSLYNKIAVANGISNPNKIGVGMVVVVPKL